MSTVVDVSQSARNDEVRHTLHPCDIELDALPFEQEMVGIHKDRTTKLIFVTPLKRQFGIRNFDRLAATRCKRGS